MTLKKLKRKMEFKKILLNKFLLFLNPTNKLTVFLSESLDKDVLTYQRLIYRSYKKHRKTTTNKAKNELIA